MAIAPHARLAVHVTPRSGRDEVCGWSAGELGIRVTVPPDGGRANLAVTELVGKALGVPKSAVRVARGASSRHKLLEVDGIAQDEAESRLGRMK